MKIFIIPVSRIYRIVRRGAVRFLGEEELESLENDAVSPVVNFIDEVYDDTVGDVMNKIKLKITKGKQK